jgi:hypothetical protein
MSKALKNSNLTSRPATRTLVAIALSLSLAAFGCTTDRTLGNGDPVTTPGLRTSPTGGTSSGSESAPTIPPSMTSSSSYVGAQALPSATNRMRRLSPAEAAAVMAQRQPRVKYLGVAYPGNGGGYVSDIVVSGQYQNPAMRTNPQLTVNSSLTSQPTSVVASGQGEAVGSTGGGVTGAAVIGGTGLGTGLTTGVTSAGITGTSTSAGLTAGTTAAGITGTSTSAGLTAGTTAAGITGTSTSAGLTTGSTAIFSPAAVATTSGTALPAGTTAAVARTGATTTLGVTNTTTANANATATTSNATAASTQSAARVSGPVRIVRDANGRAVITNASSTNGSNR